MSKTFELETLRIRMNDAEFQLLDLHQRVQRAMRELILDGALPPGLKLPATRSLAESLGIARDTVENAYMQLHRDGFIVRQQGSGSYVSETIGAELRGHSRRRVKYQEPERRAQAPGVGLSRRGNVILESEGISDQQSIKAFATGLPETRTFPTDVWERLQRQALKDYRTSVLLHGDPQGAKPLREAIATYLNLERGAKVSAEQILVLSSTRQALFLCAQLLVDAGKPILLENPGYFGAKKAFESAEAKITPIDVDAQGIRTDLLRADRSGATCVYVTPSHQYPTGATMSLERRLDLIHWAAENGRWIIEDDYDSEFRFGIRPLASLQGLDNNGQVIYLSSFSKTLFPGMRVGYMVVPAPLADLFSQGLAELYREGQLMQQAVLAEFIDEGYLTSHIRRMRGLYAARRALLIGAIQRRYGRALPVLGGEAGLHLVLGLPHLRDDWAVCRRAIELGIVTRPLSAYYSVAKRAQVGLLLGYACVPDDLIQPSFDILAHAIDEVKKVRFVRP